MLPMVLSESHVFTFKFWFADILQDGMCHQNELFCRLRTFDAKERGRVYYLGYKLSQHYTLVALTTTDSHCSLWISLRDPRSEMILKRATSLKLPSVSSSENKPIVPQS